VLLKRVSGSTALLLIQTGVIALAISLIVLVKLGISAWLLALIFFLSVLAIRYIFLRALRYTRLKAYLILVTFVLVFSVPVIFSVPYSAWVLVVLLLTVFLSYLLHSVYRKAISPDKYVFSLSWLAALVYLYVWTFTGFKAWTDYRLYNTFVSEYTLSTDDGNSKGDHIDLGSIYWEPPGYWGLRRFTPRNLFIRPFEVLTRVTPFHTIAFLDFPEHRSAGWVAAAKGGPAQVRDFVLKYIKAQEPYMWVRYLDDSEPVFLQGNEAISMFSVAVHNLQFSRDEVLYFVAAYLGSEKGEAADTLVFAFTVTDDAFLNLYIEEILKGFRKPR